ncbi:MAG: hypothetical protein Q8L55_12330 [Phycisphaerales bacterium]|nr:hypothetical protein [Phycisphaerales bacterium]
MTHQPPSPPTTQDFFGTVLESFTRHAGEYVGGGLFLLLLGGITIVVVKSRLRRDIDVRRIVALAAAGDQTVLRISAFGSGGLAIQAGSTELFEQGDRKMAERYLEAFDRALKYRLFRQFSDKPNGVFVLTAKGIALSEKLPKGV